MEVTANQLVARALRVALTALAAAIMLVGSAAPAGAVPGAAAKGKELSSEQILARNVAARGGLDAWSKVQTMVWLGHIDSTHAAVPSMPFVLEQKRPNKTRFTIHVMNESTERIFNGAQGWKQHPDHGSRPAVEPYSLEELRFAQSAPGLDGPLIDYAAKGYHVALEGTDQIEGHKTYRLRVQLSTGEVDHVWIDASSFLEMRYDRPVDGPRAGGRSVSTFYSDYRTYDGLQVPSVIETGVGSDSTPDRMMIERVVLNAPLDDERFAQPGGARRHRPVGDRPKGAGVMGSGRRPVPAMLVPAAAPADAPSVFSGPPAASANPGTP